MVQTRPVLVLLKYAEWLVRYGRVVAVKSLCSVVISGVVVGGSVVNGGRVAGGGWFKKGRLIVGTIRCANATVGRDGESLEVAAQTTRATAGFSVVAFCFGGGCSNCHRNGVVGKSGVKSGVGLFGEEGGGSGWKRIASEKSDWEGEGWVWL